mmetsp:Transcript_8578/g.22571  ORF Transcript_8578/g.22571 Transcript_8578/m.22571 type:complete len:483 (+) Transcript_8578:87-1535(+)|eukprot:CAMPEP_0185836936 /NCGR_PEP_ID=MMETSP1353-20130828/10545_1 /TAXON_ID=1077150 /ORGANISM="Erythrolobus australicus, Strain CCMP3124" /LENGTH=482 /DNA_ID=CAMNT_0028535783 /DNA_START=51 /DNA_END=1499 /DNA_ORIENTATION=+
MVLAVESACMAFVQSATWGGAALRSGEQLSRGTGARFYGLKRAAGARRDSTVCSVHASSTQQVMKRSLMSITRRIGDRVTALRGWRKLPQAAQETQCLVQQERGVPARVEHRRGTVRRSPLAHVIQVITDIDDTIKCSGGVRIAGIPMGGIDTRYARGDFYPGVFQFTLELSLHQPNRKLVQQNQGEHALKTVQKVPPLPVAVLTARARELKFALRIHRRSLLATMFQEAGVRAGFAEWGLGPVLYGSIAEWICQSRKGRRKFRNFERLMRKQKEYFELKNIAISYVYIGDTGEMDPDAANRMIEHYPKLVQGVFLHAVGDEHYNDFVQNGVPVHFFRTYIAAARKAVQCGLLDLEALVRVMKAAEQDAVQQAEAVLLKEYSGDAVPVGNSEVKCDGKILSADVCEEYPESRTLSGFYDKSVSRACLQLRLRELESDYKRAAAYIEANSPANHVDIADFSAASIFDRALARCGNFIEDSPQA